MDKIYMVTADYSSDISYGVDSSLFLCGVYASKEEANIRVSFLEKYVQKCKEELNESNMIYENEIYEKYKEILGFNVEPYMNDEWDVRIEVKELTFGDVDDYWLGGAAYAE